MPCTLHVLMFCQNMLGINSGSVHPQFGLLLPHIIFTIIFKLSDKDSSDCGNGFDSVN